MAVGLSGRPRYAGASMPRGAAQHRDGTLGGFTMRYAVKRSVWFELHDSIVTAIQRETPKWADRYPSLFIEEGPLAQLQPPEPHL